METILLKTKIGSFIGNERENSYEFNNIKYASLKRFEYAELIDKYDENTDCTKTGPSSMQKRAFSEFEHLEIPERAFYHKEFRENINFTYSEENGLNLKIYTPKEKGTYPVLVFLHGGGFDSGSIYESPFDGDSLSKRGIVVVFIQYRLGIFGYFTHEDIFNKYGHDGNFGLDDMYKGLSWVKTNISNFYGDNNNITVMGQSAGAMSIQYMLLSQKSKDLFSKAIMMSGAGLFPKFSLPRDAARTHEYWLEVMKLAGCDTLDEFKALDSYKLLEAVDKQKTLRKDNTYNTMPVVDHYLIDDYVDKLTEQPRELPLMIGITNNDMFTIILAHISKKYAKVHNAYLYYFDIDAKGDDNLAFHSCDLRYAFGTLSSSWRPYDETDYKASEIFMNYIANFVKNGNPNGDDLPEWNTYKNKAMHFTNLYSKMERIKNFKLIVNTFKGDPK